MAYFIADAGVFFFLFEPLLEEESRRSPVLALEALVIPIDGLTPARPARRLSVQQLPGCRLAVPPCASPESAMA